MIPYIVLPAFLALACKLALLAYAVWSPPKNSTARLFYALLAVLAAQNAAEFFGLYLFVKSGLSGATSFGFAYIASAIVSISLILHLSLRLSFDIEPQSRLARLQPLLYLPGIFLLYLLLLTDELVVGFQPFKNTVLRIPGPWYFLFEIYMVVSLVAALVNFLCGARPRRRPAIRRARTRLWLLAIAPMALLYIYLIIANHFGVAKLSSTIYGPIVMTLPFFAAAYATHRHRLFDVGFFVPWSKVRKRKEALYHRIRATIREIGDSSSAREVLQLLANTFHCPVALIGGARPIVVTEFGSAERETETRNMLRIAQQPRGTFEQIDRIVMAGEVEHTTPQLHALMRRHNISSIVPFHPYAGSAASWVVLGDRFSEEVYTPLDFQLVEQLFNRIRDRFIEKLLLLRSQLEGAEQARIGAEKELNAVKAELRECRRNAAPLPQPPQITAPDTATLTCLEGNKTLTEYLHECEKTVIEHALLITA